MKNSPYLDKPLRTEAQYLGELTYNHQPVIDRHMGKPDAKLLRGRDRERAAARFWREQVRYMHELCITADYEVDAEFVRHARRQHSKAIANVRAYDLLIAAREAQRGVLG